MSDLSPAGFDAYNGRLQAAALKSTKHAAHLADDLAFHRSIDRDLAKQLDACSHKVLTLTNALLDLASSSSSKGKGKGKGKGKVKLEDEDDLMDLFQSAVVEHMDGVLERADIALDKHTGRTKAPVIAVNTPPPSSFTKASGKTASALAAVVQHAAHLPKPQLKFRRPVNNASTSVWTPALKHKWNAQVPLGYVFRDEDVVEDGEPLPNHPYRYEISHLSHPARMFQSSPPIPYKSFDDTPFAWVSTQAELDVMLDHLRSAREIAVDLEHHSLRSFAGFVCLMQISTRERDFIVDTLELREELENLNEVFTDPEIVKVFHGAESDIVWLQQDFNLYIVNLFDTYHASRALSFPRHGLGTLLSSYCDFSPDKRYQLADWRVRPLTAEMAHYARADTHFLLFVYDNLRNALLDRGRSASRSRDASPSGGSPTPMPSPDALLRDVLAHSAETALRVYVPETYDPTGSSPSGYDALARKWNRPAVLSPGRVREVYVAVHAWRDRVAREEDESPGYVLPNRALFTLAERAPADIVGLVGLSGVGTPVVRRRAVELLEVVREAVKRGLEAASAVKSTVVAPVPAPAPAPTPAPQAEAPEPTDAAPIGSTAPTSLWSTPTAPAVASHSSSLFPSSTTIVAARSSALFGDASSQPSSQQQQQRRAERFKEIANRVHRDLAVVPSVPPAPQAEEAAKSTVSAVEAEAEPAPVEGAGGAEIAFVPAAQRQTVKPMEVDDAIVTVGQPKKKRKRGVKAEARAASAVDGEGGEGGSKEREVEPFDYASVPNILDDEGAERAAAVPRKSKRAKKSGGGAAGGGVGGTASTTPKSKGPAPRDRTTVKSGNVSRTFR